MKPRSETETPNRKVGGFFFVFRFGKKQNYYYISSVKKRIGMFTQMSKNNGIFFTIWFGLFKSILYNIYVNDKTKDNGKEMDKSGY